MAVQLAEDTRVVEVRTKDLLVGDVVDVHGDWRVLLGIRPNSKTGVFCCRFGDADGNSSVIFWQHEEHHRVVIKVQQ